MELLHFFFACFYGILNSQKKNNMCRCSVDDRAVYDALLLIVLKYTYRKHFVSFIYIQFSTIYLF